MKKAYQKIANNDILKIDFTEKIGFTKKKDEILKQKFDNIIVRQNIIKVCFNDILDSLNEIANEHNIMKSYLDYLLFLISNNSFIPKKFFCYFELLRLEFTACKILKYI